ncbi:MAG: four-carbon acid sugar kinase family protein [Chloroflexota bacterium]
MQPRTRVVVLDDDPTGIQTVHGCLLLTQWNRSTVELAFEDDCPFFYVLTNTRAYTTEEAREITRSIMKTILEVNGKHQDTLIFISRSDSTLRSHFPAEVDEITRLLEQQEGTRPDATFLVPAFFEGGRVTCNDTHYIREGDRFIPTAETEFARDSVFGYSTSYLPGYIEEKAGGRVLASTVRSVTLDMLRDPEPAHLADWLRSLNDNTWAVVNAECYEDLHRFTEALRQLVETGRRYVFQSAASLVKSLTETPDQPLLGAEIATGAQPGFFVVGSHVRLTTAQLQELLACSGVEGIEVDVRQILNAREAAMGAVLREVCRLASQCTTPVLYTSRQEIRFSSVQERMEAGQQISDFLSSVVRALPYSPSYLVAKGGITSHDVLAHGLELVTARVLGQILPGVPVVKSPPDHRFGEMPYVIFPGNVGGSDALKQVYEKLNPDIRENRQCACTG